MTRDFTEHTLPAAVQWLFESNGYEVEGPIHKYGAEVDLVATQLAGFAQTRVYIEATVQFVDVAKFGKDLTKLALFRNEPGVQLLIVSAKGFTLDVRERAEQVGIRTMTYEELFKSFEKCEPYIRSVLGASEAAVDLSILDEVYEEPEFDDEIGRASATKYLTDWSRSRSNNRWLVVVGEYGTGKTALTRVLQRRWMKDYVAGEDVALPFRIELKDFSKQFDARGLLHHFLDRNELAHLPIQFVEGMIAEGRVVLLLDGYDEMAQYLNVRERRACLEALADLAQGGARGILTSRPNYFTEAEELRVFEALYQRLGHRFLSEAPELDRGILEQERLVDEALDEFIMRRVERQLRDLTPGQASKLVRRRLAGDEQGAAAVIAILDRVFRVETSPEAVSLSGKPVIASYLLEVVEELKRDSSSVSDQTSALSEYQIFDLIVNKLMLRDWRRTTELMPTERRAFLRRLALELTRAEQKVVNEDQFRKLIDGQFRKKIKQRSVDGSVDAAQALFDDLRSSATLTRARSGMGFGWAFSHNTLREFLLIEEMVVSQMRGEPVSQRVPVTETMRLFVRSMPQARLSSLVASIAENWHNRSALPGLDQMLSLTWDGVVATGRRASMRELLQAIVGEGLDASGITLSGVSFSADQVGADLTNLNGSHTEFVEVDFSNCGLAGANFADAGFDACVLRGASLKGARFSGAYMLDCDITDVDCNGADFRRFDPDSTAVMVREGESFFLSKEMLLGYLNYKGAQTDSVEPYFVYMHDENFDIASKIIRYLSDETWRQRRGLEQRGVAAKNVAYAKSLVQYLLSCEYIQEKGGRAALVGTTNKGRAALVNFVQNRQIDEVLLEFFASFSGRKGS
ncbi:NACHT domain-containing protein [Micromonospora aurantiaca (nom. illeg.)]|uniref:NACHT domain-containing protein n=1 Tax=Micromonospora aurantiaca (nom. illeg.) TaxID=47850 RepID=UPI003441827F